MATHEVTNQVPDFVGHDLFATDPVLVDAIQRWGDARDADDLGGLGRRRVACRREYFRP